MQIQPETCAEPFILVSPARRPERPCPERLGISSAHGCLSPGSASRLEIALPNGRLRCRVAFRCGGPTRGCGPDQGLDRRSFARGSTTAGPKVDDAAAKDLLAKADRCSRKATLSRRGRCTSRCSGPGQRVGTVTLGATYDPNRLWSLGALGMVGNKERSKAVVRAGQRARHPERKPG